MKLPRPGLGADRVLLALWEHGPMAIDALAAVAKVKVDNLMSIAHEYKLRSATVGVYELPQSYVAHFNGCRLASEPKVEQVITPPRSINIWSAPMANYEMTLRRGMRT